MSARGRRVLAAVLDAVTYAVAVTAVVTLFAAAVSFALGAGLVGVKYALFYLGFIALAVATAVSWPARAWRKPSLSFEFMPFGGSVDSRDETVPWVNTGPSGESGRVEDTAFQRLVQRLPPARFVPAPPAARVPTGIRLFLAAFGIMGASLALEVVFGVPG